MPPAERNRRLRLLHRYNGWNLLVLLITGCLLFAPGLRAPLAPVRTVLKHFHAVDGLVTVGLLLAYLPLLPPHWLRLGSRVGQRLNVLLVIGLTLGWTVTGVVVWAHRFLPTRWANAALVWHDLLTWYALPWAALHSLTRYFHLRLPLPRWWTGRAERTRVIGADDGEQAARSPAPVLNWDRRRALSLGASAGILWLWAALSRRLGLPVPGLNGRPDGAAAEAGRVAAAEAAAAGAPPPAPADLPMGAPDYARDLAAIPVPDPLPGGGRTGRFRFYTVTFRNPVFNRDRWRFTVDGLVDRSLTLDWQQILELPRAVQVSDFHCVTGWSVHQITWEGVRLSHLLDQAGVQPAAKYVKFTSGDGVYTDALPLNVARADDVLVAYRIDGQAIVEDNGGPVRLVVPFMYGYKSVKWLQGITLQAEDHIGFWEERGYPNDAWLPQYQLS